MDSKTKTKLVNTLMSTFIKLYEDRHGKKPVFNRNTEKWGFQYLIDDLGEESQTTLAYYFTLDREHTSQDFLRNYHEFNKWMTEDAEDDARRKQLRAQTKKKVEEFEQQWQQPLK